MNFYKYTIPARGEDIEAVQFESSWDEHDAEYAAEDAAEHEWDYNEGYEETWPMTFELFTLLGESLGKFEVDVEARSSFSSRKVE